MPAPLLLTFRSTLLALDRDSGALRWRAALPMDVRRFFVEGDRVVCAVGGDGRGQVHILELARGMSEARVELHFDPTGAAILKDGKLYLASNHALACVSTAGRLVFSGRLADEAKGLFGGAPMLVISNSDGVEVARIEVGSASRRGNAGMLLDELVSQPDLLD